MVTPLEEAPPELAAERHLLLKREDLHELGAFKWRGALPALREYRGRGAEAVVTASTGNHGAATAWAAARLGMRAIVFVPEAVSGAKADLLGALGAELRPEGADLDVAKELARAHAAQRRLPFFEDGAEPAQFRGYAAIGRELLDQLGEPPGAVVVPIGNGALMVGVAHELRQRSPATSRVGVVAKDAPVMALSIEAGRPVECNRCATFADGMAVRVGVPLAVRELVALHLRLVRVSERALAGGGRLRRCRHPGGGLSRRPARRSREARHQRSSSGPTRHRTQHRRRAPPAGGGAAGELPGLRAECPFHAKGASRALC